MFEWITDNLITILALAAVLLLIAGAIFTLVRDKKRGVSSCGSRCAGCPMAGQCHGAKKAEDPAAKRDLT